MTAGHQLRAMFTNHRLEIRHRAKFVLRALLPTPRERVHLGMHMHIYGPVPAHALQLPPVRQVRVAVLIVVDVHMDYVYF